MVVVETVVGIEVGHVLVGLGIGRDFHVAVDAEHLADRHLHVGQAGDFLQLRQSLILHGFGPPEARYGPIRERSG